MSDESRDRQPGGAPTFGLTETTLTSIESPTASIEVSRVQTPKGARLELRRGNAPDERTRLDAVSLECLTWQERSTFTRLADEFGQQGDSDAIEVTSSVIIEEANPTEEPEHTSTALTRITNEFAHANVDQLTTDQTEYLEILAPKLNQRIALNADALDALIDPPMSIFDELIRDEIE